MIAGFIFRTIHEITKPFTSLAKVLAHDSSFDCVKEKITGEPTYESQLTLAAVNQYRARIREFLTREQSFTRYISHELRTPMTVIKGATSLLKNVDQPQVTKQCTRINQAIDNMEQLTQTLLLLARNNEIRKC